jgi:hypothetical protein
MAIKLKEGQPLPTRSYATTTTTAYVEDEPLKLADNVVVAATTGDKVLFLSKQVKLVGDASTDAIEVVPVGTGQVYVFTVVGTMSNDYVDETCDITSSGAVTLTLANDTNHDVLLVGWDGINTDKAFGVFLNTAF